MIVTMNNRKDGYMEKFNYKMYSKSQMLNIIKNDAFLSYRKLQKSSNKKMFATRLKKHILKIHIKNWKYMYIT